MLFGERRHHPPSHGTYFQGVILLDIILFSCVLVAVCVLGCCVSLLTEQEDKCKVVFGFLSWDIFKGLRCLSLCRSHVTWF